MADRPNNVVGLPIPVVEAYLTRDELATVMRVHVNTIDRWVIEGMPSEVWGKRTRRFQASRAIAWARTRGSEAA